MILVCMLLTDMSVCAQQLPQYSLAQYNPLVINPAYAGMGSSMELNGHLRKQWVGLEGSPFTQQINGHMPIPFWYGGAGIVVTNDLIGAERNTSANLSLAYKILRKRSYVMSVGLSVGLAQKGLDGSLLISPDGDYETTINHADGIIATNSASSLQPDLGLGLFVMGDEWSAGISVLNLVAPKYRLSGESGDAVVNGQQHFYGTASYRYVLSNRIALKPSVVLQSNLKQIQSQFNIVVEYDEFIDAGVALRGYSSRSLESVSFIVGMKLSDQWRMGYAYDAGISALRGVNSGSHEFVLNYKLKSFYTMKGGKVIYNPRFL